MDTAAGATIEAAVKAVLARPYEGVMVLAGAGSAALRWLLSVGGASGFLLEALVPYSAASMADFLGYQPHQHVSVQTARAMARRAYHRAWMLSDPGAPVVGVACTATIATHRPKRGDHRVHVATFGENGLALYSLTLTKGARDRAGEEDVVSRLVLRALVRAVGAEAEVSLPLLPGEEVQVTPDGVRVAVDRLLSGETRSILVNADGEATENASVRGAILPGSFNPLHHAHLKLASVAAEMLGAPVTFEVSVTNVDKPPLTAEEIMHRLAQFACRGPVALTQAPLYSEKAALFPGCTFVIGCDTAARLFEPRYYGGSTEGMYRALESIEAAGCRFLVAGRADADGVFRTLDDIPMPARFHHLLRGIPEAVFREDISSTALRDSTAQERDRS